jgi:hypothetical protein
VGVTSTNFALLTLFLWVGFAAVGVAQAQTDPDPLFPSTPPTPAGAISPLPTIEADPFSARMTPLFPLRDLPAQSTPIPADASLPSSSHNSSGRVIGQILNQVGQPVEAAQIQMGDQIDPTANQTGQQPITTDSKGAFELLDLPVGRWPLTIWHPDYETMQTEIWVQSGLTTPVEIVLNTPIEPQAQTRLGVLGVGGLDNTQYLGQRLAIESVRQGLIPAGETIVPLDNRKLLPILRKIGLPLYELFERDRQKPAAVQQFFDYLGLKAIVITRVDVLSRPASPTEIKLNSRSRLELWTFDDQGQLQVRTLDEAGRSKTEKGNLNSADITQLYQIQVTEMAEEVGNRWQQNSPLSGYFDPNQTPLSPQRSRLDTTVELRIPVETPQPAPVVESPPTPLSSPDQPSPTPEPGS